MKSGLLTHFDPSTHTKITHVSGRHKKRLCPTSGNSCQKPFVASTNAHTITCALALRLTPRIGDFRSQISPNGSIYASHFPEGSHTSSRHSCGWSCIVHSPLLGGNLTCAHASRKVLSAHCCLSFPADGRPKCS